MIVEPVIDQYRRKLEVLRAEYKKSQKLFPNGFERVGKSIDAYEAFLDNPDIEVAVVGSIKAGKSTLLNAILGNNIASTDVTPETAALSVFRHSKQDTVRVSFYNKEEWDAIWESANKSGGSIFKKEFEESHAEEAKMEWLGHDDVNEFPASLDALRDMVKEFSSSQSSKHYFVKKIEIGLSDFPLPKELVFVDTPGLNDVLPYRSDITTTYIKRANAVIVCVNAKTLRHEEYLTLVKASENIGADKRKMIILGTQVDSFNQPKDDWANVKNDWAKKLEDLYKDAVVMEQNVLGVSAKMYSLMRRVSDNESLDNMDIRDVVDFSEKNGIHIPPLSNDLLTKAKLLLTGGNPQKLEELIQENQTKRILDNSEGILASTRIPAFISTLISGPLSEPEKVLAADLKFRYDQLVTELRNQSADFREQIEKLLKLLTASIAEKEAAIAEKKQQFERMQEAEDAVKYGYDTMKDRIEQDIKDLKAKLFGELKTKGGV